MRTIAVLNQKGGVGKTTTTVNSAAALAKMGNKVAVVDMDPQAHLTIHLGINPETAGPGVYEVLTKSADFKENLNEVRENLFLLGANINLVGAESELVSVVGREIILREAINDIKDDFDYLIIDCAPSLGLLTLNGLAAVDEVFIPLQPHFLALQGFGKLLQTVSLVSKRINPKLRVTGILLCMFDTRATLSGEVKNDIQNFLNGSRQSDCPWSDAQVIPIHIRRNIKLAEAPSYGQTIFEYEPECNGSYDYMAVAEFVHKNMGPNAQIETDDNIPENTPENVCETVSENEEKPQTEPQNAVSEDNSVAIKTPENTSDSELNESSKDNISASFETADNISENLQDYSVENNPAEPDEDSGENPEFRSDSNTSHTADQDNQNRPLEY